MIKQRIAAQQALIERTEKAAADYRSRGQLTLAAIAEKLLKERQSHLVFLQSGTSNATVTERERLEHTIEFLDRTIAELERAKARALAQLNPN